MFYFVLKCTLSGIIIAVVSEIAKRSPALGALIVSLPLVSLLGILWLWHDTGNVERIADHAEQRPGDVMHRFAPAVRKPAL